MKQILIITNNPSVVEKYQNYKMIEKKTFEEVLIQTRDLIHQGHKLITHPLYGSVKPNESPYRSIIVSLNPEKLCFKSLSLIENAIRKFEQFKNDAVVREWPEKVLQDFQVVDITLFTSGFESLVE
ncbi:MAG: GrdX family protein [Halanaerobiales bacterium]|nr:GrdX family protein [Halanaerobiales bacterium]